QVVRERLLRLNDATTGHRLLRGAVDVASTRVRALPTDAELVALGEAFDDVVELALSNSVVVDRFEGTAVLTGVDAAAIGTLGVVARASGLAVDARVAHPFADAPFSPVRHDAGDVMARFRQRVDEFRASLEMVRHLAGSVTRLDAGADRRGAPMSSGVGIVEGWRGTVVHRVELDENGRVARARTLDPSFFNWPALAIALTDTIVPDFPLANKSFNLSYAGNDL
ncbi:MAG: formate hydrogenase, partial [Acidobacteria bacterium]|nr:formate hydrogenase [Acidobacteriota bacterium]